MPPHAEHVWVRTNSPKAVRDTCCSRPMPPHCGQLTGAVPGSSPLPWHVSQAAATWNATLRVTPCAASASSIDTSAPDVGAPPAAPTRGEQVVAEERREEIRQAPQVERGRDVATVPQAVEAVAVVELASLGAGEHLVCLHDLLEPLVGVRGVRDVRMELAREAPKRLLDGGAVRVAADAEHVVVVPPHAGVNPRRTCSRRDATAPRRPRGRS